MKKIGVSGSAMVGKTLAAGFVKHGHEVMIGSREPEKLAEWQGKEGKGVQAGSVEETAAFGEIIVLAVKGKAAQNALKLAGAHLKTKTVIDTTNPIGDAPPQNGVLNFFSNINRSLMEELQEVHPYVNFVKAFNSVGSAYMVNPDFKDGKPTMFICGNNEKARKEVMEILDRFGWDTADMGEAEAARAIEPLCMLWCIPGMRENKWNHAFKLLR